MFVKTSASWLVESLSTLPGMLSGPAVLCGSTLDKCGLVCLCVVLSSKPHIEVIQHVREKSITAVGLLWCNLVVWKGLHALPNASGVLSIAEVVVNLMHRLACRFHDGRGKLSPG